MKITKVAGALLLAAASQCSFAALSADDEMRYVFLNGRYIDADKARGADKGLGGHFGAGFRLTKNLFAEGSVFAQNYETGNGVGTDFYGRGAGLDLVYAMGDRRSFTPYFMAGGGGAWNYIEPKREGVFSPYLNIGAGFVTPLLGSEFIKLRGEVRRSIEFTDQRFSDTIINAGLEVEYGRKKTIEKIVEKPVDRIVTKTIEKVVEKPVDRIVEKPVDRIVERVVDRPIEKRVEVIKLVDKPDSDQDNIPDDKDLCPNTPPKARTDNTGCVLKNQVVRFEKIYFDFDKTTLRPESIPAIIQVSKMLAEQPELSMEIAGHTDSKGEDAYNERLSRGRAASVLQALLQAGVQAKRLRSQGYGEKFPIATNETDEGRQLNRRVEMRID